MEVDIQTDDYLLVFEVVETRDSFDHEFGSEYFYVYSALGINEIYLPTGEKTQLPCSEKFILFNKYSYDAELKAGEMVFSETAL